MNTSSTMVIVGASLPGTSAAQTLRSEGFGGRIVLLGEEPELPYERPPLSKGYLTGETPRRQVYLYEPGFYAAHDIEVRTGARVVDLNLAASEVVLQAGERLAFDWLLLATGAEPRRLSVFGAELDGVHYLRGLADADALREQLGRGGRVVVVAAGWIGAEIAESLRTQGLPVTVMDPLPLPLLRVLGPELGEFYRDLHAAHGVQLLLGTGLAAIEGADRVQRVLTTDGRSIDADVVVVGIGVRPRAELAERAGLAVDNGVVVDERLVSSDRRVFAAGDVARAWHPFYGEHVRVEHWSVARDQGAAAAAACSARAMRMTSFRPFTPISTTARWSTAAERSTPTRWSSEATARGVPGVLAARPEGARRNDRQRRAGRRRARRADPLAPPSRHRPARRPRRAAQRADRQTATGPRSHWAARPGGRPGELSASVRRRPTPCPPSS